MMKSFCQGEFSNHQLAELAGRLARHLQLIYKSEFSEGMVNRILVLVNKYFKARQAWNEKDVVLITYGDTFYKQGEFPLHTLHRFLSERCKGKINCVHILPFFPYTSDDGFAITDFTTVNPDLGNWDHIDRIASEFDLMTDLVINHVSARHKWFSNYLADKSPGKDFFIEADTDADYSRVNRPRSTPLFTRFETSNGTKDVWTTFSADQIDLNFSNPEVLFAIIQVLLLYIRHGARIIRLDAIAFLWKEKGTSCLHLCETHEIVKLLRDIAIHVCPGTIILTETNVPNAENWSYFGLGDEAHMVYQFTLPPLLLYSLFTGNARYLSNWASKIPEPEQGQTYFNFTASHDGIGLRPIEGLLSNSEIGKLIDSIKSFGGLVSEKINSNGTLSPYEMNITYFDALKGNVNGIDQFQEERFICSQVISIALKGIPAIYIQSLLGASNYYEGFKNTGRARTINRRQWNEEEMVHLLTSNTTAGRIYGELMRIIDIRIRHAAFHPEAKQQIMDYSDKLFAVKRFNNKTGEEIVCISNISNEYLKIQFSSSRFNKRYEDLIAQDDVIISGGEIRFAPYQSRWLKGN